MGILDEAIKEHLELKRRHGAAESELEELEDEAFGAAERPGSEEGASESAGAGEEYEASAEAPTEFMARPGAAEGEPAESEAPPRRRVSRAEIGDLQEGPEPAPEERGEAEPAEEGPVGEEPADYGGPAEEESPAMEHEAISETEPRLAEPPDEPPPEPAPEPPQGPSTEEREAIAEQPTEMYDVEGELAGSEPPAPPEAPEPPEAPAEEEPAEEPSAAGEEEEDLDDFFDERRLSEELDQALDAPGEAAAPGEDEEAAEAGEEYEEAGEGYGEAAEEGSEEGSEEDLLEETPDFLEEAPEDDRLWFEQNPPKDFDFDD